MRVGIVLTSDTESGGGFQHEIAILENLKLHAANSRHQFFVFCNNFQFDKKSLECNNLKFIEVKKKIFILRLIDNIFIQIKKKFRIQFFQSIKTPINKAIDKNNIEIIYYPGPYSECTKIDIPYILTIWDLQHRLHPEFPEVSSVGKWNYREQFYQEAIGKASAIIVDEKAGKEDVIQFYNIREEKVFVLPFIPAKMNRVKDIDFQSVQDKYGINSEYIFYPAQFWPHKNHIAILKAIKNLKEKSNIDIYAVFTGSNKGNLSYIKKLTDDLGLTKQIFFLGFVPDEDIPALYKGALALVMPTYFGPSNIPVYEAFAYQCPVITSNIRGIREQVGDAGILIDPGDHIELSKAILMLRQDEILKKKIISEGDKKIKSWTGKDYIESFIKIIDTFSSVRSCWD